jgi:hypothetical protein
MKRIALSVLALALALPAYAGELAGVTMPDTATVAGQTLVLNGMALREKYFLDIYVGGLYLPAKSSDGASVIAQDAPKRLHMSFIYSEVPAEKTIETYREIWELDPAYPAQKTQADLFCSWIADLESGDTMTIQYEPGKGTTLLVNDQPRGTIPGVEFMKLIFGNYVGPNANKVLRKGLLGA